VIVILMLVLGVLWFLSSARSDARKTRLQKVAAQIGGTASSAGLVGKHLGVDVTLELGSRGSGKNRSSWTFVEAVLPPGYPFSMHLRRHGWFDEGKIAAGNMVDVQLGDPELDAAFLIEAAPAALICRLLDADARAFLRQHQHADVSTDAIELRLAVPGWEHPEEVILQALTFVARIAGGIREATAALDAEVPAAASGPVFREHPDDRPLQEARAARVAEVAKLNQVQKERASREQSFYVVLLVLLVLGFVAMNR